jgi:hypothetical protein
LPSRSRNSRGLLGLIAGLVFGFAPAIPAAEPTVESGLPPEIAAEVAGIEAAHRDVLAMPVETWRFDSIKGRYTAVLGRANTATARNAVQARLELVARHEEAARSARTFQAILDKSRRRDLAVEKARKALAALERPDRRPFVAQGLIQRSSREVEGRRVYALIGPEGNPVAYLDVPPGLDAVRLATKRVGVRGSVHYSDTLGSRLIAVRDLEPLE